MKRAVCLLLLLLILFCGCSKEEKVCFYYRSENYLANHNGSILFPETRNVTGYTDNPEFLISLYLAGPLNQDLQSPFPEGTKIQSLLIKDQQFTIELQELPQDLTDAEFSLACACLTMTCLEFSDTQSVTILCGSRSLTLNQSSFTLFDTPNPIQTSDGGSS